MSNTRNNNIIVKGSTDITGIKVTIKTEDFELDSNLENLSDDLLERVIDTAVIVLRERDPEYQDYINTGGM